jgi:hypothetical protein
MDREVAGISLIEFSFNLFTTHIPFMCFIHEYLKSATFPRDLFLSLYRHFIYHSIQNNTISVMFR